MKNKLPFITFVLVLCICFAAFPLLQSEGTEEDFVIILDAGHGGEDGGAVSASGKCEKDLNLDMTLKLSEKLSSMGYETVLTRTEDSDTDNETGFNKRKDILNRLAFTEKYPNSVFISVHMNSSTSPNDKGFQVFYGKKNGLSVNLAEAVHFTVENFAYTSRLREVKIAPDSVYLMVNSSVPSALVECGFISNKTDETLLLDEKYRDGLSYSIACGIDKFCVESGFNTGKTE